MYSHLMMQAGSTMVSFKKVSEKDYQSLHQSWCVTLLSSPFSQGMFVLDEDTVVWQ